MKFYRSPTNFIEIMQTDDARLRDVLQRKYGYIDDFSGFSDKVFLEFSKSEKFVIFTKDTLFREDVLTRQDRTCKTLEDFLKTNSVEEQWRYYKYFIQCEPGMRYMFSGIHDQYVAFFDEAGVVTIYYDGEYIVHERNGIPEAIEKMSRVDWETYIKRLKKAGQIKE